MHKIDVNTLNILKEGHLRSKFVNQTMTVFSSVFFYKGREKEG